MSNVCKRVLCSMLVSVGIACGLSLSNNFMVTGPMIVKPAQAYIGNPLTPLSYTGVARRTARRAYFFGGGYPYAATYPYAALYPYPAYPSPYSPPYWNQCDRCTSSIAERWPRFEAEA
jgi:hypothetical protein